jgi:hypothetical protein
MADPSSDSKKIEVNADYVTSQLSKAIGAVAREQEGKQEDIGHDASASKRAQVKLAKWLRVVSCMLTGQLQIGSRLPVSDVPAWATLEVAQGGFATGRLLAEGEVQEHERQLAARLDIADGISLRAALNAYFLSPQGLSELKEMLASKRYRIDVPEESALLVVAYLLDSGNVELAKQVLEEIAPFFSRLRFYPVPHSESLHYIQSPQSIESESPIESGYSGSLVHLQSVAKTRSDFGGIRSSLQLERQREALSLWLPLYDRVVLLFAQTRLDGWPCQHYPDGWSELASDLHKEIEVAIAHKTLCQRSFDSKNNASRLFKYLDICVRDRASLSGRDVGMIRAILQQIENARGLPDAEKTLKLRAEQRAVAAQPSAFQLAQVVGARLQAKLEMEALSSLEEIIYPVTAAESEKFQLSALPQLPCLPLLPAGYALPAAFATKVLRSVEMPLSELVQRKIVSSSEQLAPVVASVSAQLQARAFSDPALQALYAATYASFRRRRSLLLLHLAKQVQLQELPWVRVLDHYKQDDAVKALARETLTQVCAIIFKNFPQQILPNKMLQEIRFLAKCAGLQIPIVEELAADIFMGEFSPKYKNAAVVTTDYLRGTIYERYYSLNEFSASDLSNNDLSTSNLSASNLSASETSKGEDFAKFCQRRALAGQAGSDQSENYVAANGMVIEQEQIFTSHNLATLFSELELDQILAADLEEMIRSCFIWICRTLQLPFSYWDAQLRDLKNAAYAWRQMIFFLSVLGSKYQNQAAMFDWMDEYLNKQKPDFIKRFTPALKALRQAQTEPIDPSQRFLGWTTKRHWLAP